MEKNDAISILYVEDQDDVRLFLSKILSRHYSKLFLAENGKQGLELFKEHRPDIVISDIKMPVMDGLSMSSRIKEIDPKAKIILTTAHSDMEYFIQSIEIGISQYILKPIDREKLYTAINSCKDQVLMEREIEMQHIYLQKNNEMLTRHERELRENLQKTIALKESITRSEENFRKVAENIQDTFWLSNSKNILFVNAAFELMFEIPGSKLIEDPSIFKNYIHEDDRVAFLQNLNEHEKKKDGSLNTEFRIITPSGQIKNIWYRDILIKAENPKDYRRLCTLTDISWKIEKEQLQQSLFMAEKSVQIKHRILANVSHEMRTPLNGILVMSQILANTNLSQEQKDYLSTIINSGEALMEIMSNLLDINELENNNVNVTLEKLHSVEFFSSIANEHSHLAENKGIDFAFNFSSDFPEVFITDPKLLNQIIRHLLGNAIKFTHQGQVTFNLSVLDADKNNWILKLEVIDTGIGIRQENLKKVFQLFSQQEEDINRRHEGLGLGLTICKRIAVLLRGNLEVESEEGKGSRFIFNFPAMKEYASVDTSVIKQKAPELNLKILYAEDKEVNQKTISIILHKAGCTVDIAPNGKEALDMVEKADYDIILMDIQMPVMDGITATRELKKRYKNPPPIIGVSANALRADAQHYISKGLDDYIAKPVLPAVLYEKLQIWSGKKPRNIQQEEKHESIPVIPSDYTLLPELDFTTLESLREQTDYDDQIINDLYSTYLMESEALVEKIQAAIAEKKFGELKDATHALKGLSATIGAMRIYHVSTEMDKLHKLDIYDQSEALLEVLMMDYHKVLKIIRDQVLNNS
jgi:signal transduction histidine kinase/DNA-binding response OmpR family regulator